MLAKRDAYASLHSDFYRHYYYRLLRWLIVLLIIMFLLIGAILYMIFTEPPRQFYANTVEGKILSMPPST